MMRITRTCPSDLYALYWRQFIILELYYSSDVCVKIELFTHSVTIYLNYVMCFRCMLWTDFILENIRMQLVHFWLRHDMNWTCFFVMHIAVPKIVCLHPSSLMCFLAGWERLCSLDLCFALLISVLLCLSL